MGGAWGAGPCAPRPGRARPGEAVAPALSAVIDPPGIPPGVQSEISKLWGGERGARGSWRVPGGAHKSGRGGGGRGRGGVRRSEAPPRRPPPPPPAPYPRRGRSPALGVPVGWGAGQWGTRGAAGVRSRPRSPNCTSATSHGTCPPRSLRPCCARGASASANWSTSGFARGTRQG